jgi:VIT1/CCC1 family predicted Fe2+/Mn2+ transporter
VLLIPLVAIASLASLALLGALAAKVGGAPVRTAALRVLFWGALAMALTSLIGRLFGVMA